jgi:cupin fold WbuC family metalloprotein
MDQILVGEQDFLKDPLAKSLAFYPENKASFIHLTEPDLQNLRELGAKENVRFNLHRSPSHTHHNMIVLEHLDNEKISIHKHRNDGELWYLVEGIAEVSLFSEKGDLINQTKLVKGDFFRVGDDIYHCIKSVSPYIVYLETKSGPFTKSSNIAPDWDSKTLTRNINLVRKRLQSK